MPESYPAITIWQPWATLIAEGVKPYEFRGWPVPKRLIGRRIAIHAGARPMRAPEINDLIYRLSRDDWRETGLTPQGSAMDILERAWNAPRSLPLSSIVCIATLGKPMRGAEMAAAMGLDAINDSDRWDHSNWGWPLTDIERLEPFVPARGAQGFWTWRREMADA